MIRLLALLGILLLVNPVHAERYFFWNKSYPSQAIYGPQQLTYEINQIVNAESTAAIAVYIKSMKNGDNLYTRNIHSPLMPASILKIMTAEAALLYLGPNYKFTTQLATDGTEVVNGVLQGNLYLVLGGDPTLTFSDLSELIQILRAQHITGISGNVYIDNTAYDQNFYGPGWEWKDKNYCYAAPISATIINHNCFSFKVTPAKTPGKLAQIVTYPKYFYPKIVNGVVTKSKPKRQKKHNCSLHLSPGAASSINLAGCMPQGPYEWGVSYVVTDVNEYMRNLVKSLLAKSAIHVQGSYLYTHSPGNLTLIGSHTSKSLTHLVSDMLKRSDNIIAGALFKKIGQKYHNRSGTWENASIAVSQILAKHAGMKTNGLKVLDGSGLSPANLTTPAQMMQVLDFAIHHSSTSYPFIAALPIAGVDGTLKHRLTNIPRKVRAKTGTITGVVSLAGYVVSADKEPLAFVIMINGTKGLGWRYRLIEDNIATALARFRR